MSDNNRQILLTDSANKSIFPYVFPSSVVEISPSGALIPVLKSMSREETASFITSPNKPGSTTARPTNGGLLGYVLTDVSFDGGGIQFSTTDFRPVIISTTDSEIKKVGSMLRNTIISLIETTTPEQQGGIQSINGQTSNIVVLSGLDINVGGVSDISTLTINKAFENTNEWVKRIKTRIPDILPPSSGTGDVATSFDGSIPVAIELESTNAEDYQNKFFNTVRIKGNKLIFGRAISTAGSGSVVGFTDIDDLFGSGKFNNSWKNVLKNSYPNYVTHSELPSFPNIHSSWNTMLSSSASIDKVPELHYSWHSVLKNASSNFTGNAPNIHSTWKPILSSTYTKPFQSFDDLFGTYKIHSSWKSILKSKYEVPTGSTEGVNSQQAKQIALEACGEYDSNTLSGKYAQSTHNHLISDITDIHSSWRNTLKSAYTSGLKKLNISTTGVGFGSGNIINDISTGLPDAFGTQTMTVNTRKLQYGDVSHIPELKNAITEVIVSTVGSQGVVKSVERNYSNKNRIDVSKSLIELYDINTGDAWRNEIFNRAGDIAVDFEQINTSPNPSPDDLNVIVGFKNVDENTSLKKRTITFKTTTAKKLAQIMGASSSLWSETAQGMKKSNAFIDGEVYATGGFYETSDERKKNIIRVIDPKRSYEMLDNIRLIEYTLKDDSSECPRIGVVAQEIEQHFPEVVSHSMDSGSMTVDYAKLSVVALSVLKDMRREIEDLRNELDALKHARLR